MARLISLRREAFMSQDCRCYYCQLPMWDGDNEAEFAAKHRLTTALAQMLRATAEHLEARQDGGKDKPGNIVAACLFCNRHRHQGRESSAPSPGKYLALVRRRIAAGKWHPANGRLFS